MEIDDVVQYVAVGNLIKGKFGDIVSVTIQKDWPIGFEIEARWVNDGQRKKLIRLAETTSDKVEWDNTHIHLWFENLQVAALCFVKAARITGVGDYERHPNTRAYLFGKDR